jgi:hypothetical protein
VGLDLNPELAFKKADELNRGDGVDDLAADQWHDLGEFGRILTREEFRNKVILYARLDLIGRRFYSHLCLL